jgi:single-strand DNA-binding protein
MSELKLPEINRVLLTGRLTRDPDRRYAADGVAVTRFDIAFHRRFRARGGQVGESTGFITVGTAHRLAEVCGEYLKKGSAVLVEGRLQQREWQTPRGEKRNRLEIQADNVHFLERRSGPLEGEGGETSSKAPAGGPKARIHGERS